MKRISKNTTARYMMIAIVGQFLFFLVVGLLVSIFLWPFEPPLPYALGLLLGCVFSIVKVILLERSIDIAIGKEKNEAKNYAQAQYLLRLGLTIASLLLAVFIPTVFGLFGTIIGFLTLQFSAYIANAMLKRKGYPE